MLRLHVFNPGGVTLREERLYLGGERTPHTLPVLCFVAEHPRGLVVFDAGLHAAFGTAPRRYVGPLTDLALPFRSRPGMTLSAQMELHGLCSESVTHVVLSHLHFDHTGDLRAFSRAQRYVARQEWQAAQSRLSRLRGYLRKEYAGLPFTLLDLSLRNGLTLEQVSRDGYGVDLMGDGSLIVVPTFGHTPGHQSLLVFLSYGAVLLAGDAVYARAGYARPAAQPCARSPDVAWRTLMAVRALAKGDPNALILPAHDDSALRDLRRPDVLVHDATTSRATSSG
jgi:glyoxylase-like metal-dependent hydrolase (beta-lactamase superfamily II)